MRLTSGFAVVATLAACSARIDTNANTETPDATSDGLTIDATAPTIDASPDAEILGAWGTPSKIGTAATAAAEDDGTLSSTGLELVYGMADPADANVKHLFYAQRATPEDEFGASIRVSFSVTGAADQTPRFSADDKTLYFGSRRTPNLGLSDIWQVPHPAPGDSWGTPAPLTEASGVDEDKWFMPCGAEGRYLISRANDIAEGTLGGGPPTAVAELSTLQSETGTFVTDDCLTIYFVSNRATTDLIYTSSRASITALWTPPVVVTDFNMLAGSQQDPWIASDNRAFVFVSAAAGNNDVYISTR